jgi:Large polyvalent protein associated domain 23
MPRNALASRVKTGVNALWRDVGNTPYLDPRVMAQGETMAQGAQYGVPGFGDAMGLVADAGMYATDSSSRNWKNYLLTGLGALPFVPGAAHAIFAGPLAKTADLTELERAKAMLRMGATDDDVWRATGWWVNTPDGVPRFEIDDSAARVWGQNPDNLLNNNTPAGEIGREFIIGNNRGLRVNDIIQNGGLFEAYPKVAESFAATQRLPPGTRGVMQHGPFGAMVVDESLDPLQTLSTAHHEIQHKIQRIEDMARGGSPNEPISNPKFASYQKEMDSNPLLKELNDIQQSRAYTEELMGFNRLWKEKYQPMLFEARSKVKERGDTANFKKEVDAVFKQWEAESAGKFPAVERATALEKSLGEQKVPLSPPPEFIQGEDVYRQLMGEAEARAVQARLPYDSARRRATPPWQSYDVPLNSLIIRK